MILKVKDSGRLFFLQNYAEPYKIYLAECYLADSLVSNCDLAIHRTGTRN